MGKKDPQPPTPEEDTADDGVPEAKMEDLDFVFIDETPVAPARRQEAPDIDPTTLVEVTLEGHSYRSDGEIRIGRGVDNHLVARRDRSVSRYHCRILREGNHAVIQDLGSRWGTFVNGERVERQYLRGDERIQLARSILKLRLVSTPTRKTPRSAWPGAVDENLFEDVGDEPTLDGLALDRLGTLPPDEED